jgi:hypothetical protein
LEVDLQGAAGRDDTIAKSLYIYIAKAQAFLCGIGSGGRFLVSLLDNI